MATTADAPEQEPVGRRPVILVADDEVGVTEAFAERVRRYYGGEYEVEGTLPAGAALAACTRLRDEGKALALLIAGEGVRSHGGPSFLAEARSLHPGAVRVLLSSHDDTEAAIAAANEIAVSRFLVKPSESPEDVLFPILDELLRDWRAGAGLPYARVKDVMQTGVARIRSDDNLRRAAEVVAETGVGDLMVIDESGNFVGVLSEGDILRSALPDLPEILGTGGTLYDAYQLFMRKARDLSDKPITRLVIREPLVMHPDHHVAQAATILVDRQIRRLPVVLNGKLVGTVSRADICRAVVQET